MQLIVEQQRHHGMLHVQPVQFWFIVWECILCNSRQISFCGRVEDIEVVRALPKEWYRLPFSNTPLVTSEAMLIREPGRLHIVSIESLLGLRGVFAYEDSPYAESVSLPY